MRSRRGAPPAPARLLPGGVAHIPDRAPRAAHVDILFGRFRNRRPLRHHRPEGFGRRRRRSRGGLLLRPRATAPAPPALAAGGWLFLRSGIRVPGFLHGFPLRRARRGAAVADRQLRFHHGPVGLRLLDHRMQIGPGLGAGLSPPVGPAPAARAAASRFSGNRSGLPGASGGTPGGRTRTPFLLPAEERPEKTREHFEKRLVAPGTGGLPRAPAFGALPAGRPLGSAPPGSTPGSGAGPPAGSVNLAVVLRSAGTRVFELGHDPMLQQTAAATRKICGGGGPGGTGRAPIFLQRSAARK